MLRNYLSFSELIRVSNESKLQKSNVYIGYNRRYYQSVQKCRELLEDNTAAAPSRPTGSISPDEQLLMDQEDQQRDAIFDIAPPQPPIPVPPATLDPTQQELYQRRQEMGQDVTVDATTTMKKDNLPEIGIQQDGISAIAVKLGYDFTYYKSLVEKQQPPSKDPTERKKQLEICIKEFGSFIPIIPDDTYESVLEIYTLKYIYNEHLRFERKWKMALINNTSPMPGAAAATGTGLAVSLETMGMNAEEAIRRLSAKPAAQAAPQAASTSQFKMSQTTGRMPFAATGRTGERGQPIYDIPKAKPGSETTVPPLSRQVKGNVEKTADKKPPVIPDEYKDFIMKWDTKCDLIVITYILT